MRTETEKYIIRFPHGMRGEIKKSAARNNRSMNSEIIFHLKRIFSAKNAASKQETRGDSE